MSTVTKLPVAGGVEPKWEDRVIRGMDAFINTATGAGTAADKFSHTQFRPGATLDHTLLESLYIEHDLAATIVERIVQDALRSGYMISWKDADDVDRRNVMDWAETTYAVTEEVKQGRIWSRLFGGAGVVMGIDGNIETEAFPGAPVKFLRAVPGHRLPAELYYDVITDQKYGKPVIYKHEQLRLNQFQAVEPFVMVHESRVVPFYGVKTTDEQTIRDLGWGKSVLHRVYDVLLKFDQGFDSVLHTLLEMSVPVYKVKALLDLLASENGELLAKRFELINTAKSQFRAVILDMEETFERIEASLSEATGVVELAMLRVSGAAQMPSVLLFGRSPAGQNATGASDLENWNQSVRSEQNLVIGPALQKIYQRLLAQSDAPFTGKAEDITIEFPPVETLSIQEEANFYMQLANADTQYEAMGAVSAAEIAKKRSQTSRLFPGVDMAYLDELDEVRKESVLNPPAPPPMMQEGESDADDDTDGDDDDNANGDASASA